MQNNTVIVTRIASGQEAEYLVSYYPDGTIEVADSTRKTESGLKVTSGSTTVTISHSGDTLRP